MTDAAPGASSTAPTVDEEAAAPAEAPPFPEGTRSLRLRRSVAVHLEPSEASPRIGAVARDIRVGWRAVAEGDDCEGRWVELEPRGWVCSSYLEPSERAAWGVELPRVDRGRIVPGVFAKVVLAGARTYARDALGVTPTRVLQGAVKVRREGEADAGGVRYWRISRDEYIAAEAVRELEPSSWQGVRLGDETGWTLPLGFAFSAVGRGRRPVTVYDGPASERAVGRLAPRERVAVLESADGAFRIGDGRWVRAVDLRVAEAAEPPPHTLDGERWFDIDLDRQLLVAYEGAVPVYVTLISTGSRKYPSETGVWRVFSKLAETDMNGQMGDEAPYSVATVPWTQFYARDLALHTAYWHDGFGEPRSHGCINLAPLDARFLYFWSEPSVPAGWSSAFGLVEHPGSLVRVRSAGDPNPDLKGYARRIAEARAGAARASAGY